MSPLTADPRRRRPLVTLGRCAAVLGLVAAVAVIGTLALPADSVAGEGGVLETVQLTTWGASALVALASIRRQRAARDRWNALWLGVIALGIMWREMDGHIWLNPETLGPWGVRYRIDWWLDGSVPVVVKAVWAGAVLLGAALLIVPLVKARPDGLRQLRRLDPGALMFMLAIAGMGSGYVADDLLGRGLLVEPRISKVFEETGELVGAAAYLLCVLASVTVPLDAREGRG